MELCTAQYANHTAHTHSSSRMWAWKWRTKRDKTAKTARRSGKENERNAMRYVYFVLKTNKSYANVRTTQDAARCTFMQQSITRGSSCSRRRPTSATTQRCRRRRRQKRAVHEAYVYIPLVRGSYGSYYAMSTKCYSIIKCVLIKIYYKWMWCAGDGLTMHTAPRRRVHRVLVHVLRSFHSRAIAKLVEMFRQKEAKSNRQRNVCHRS